MSPPQGPEKDAAQEATPSSSKSTNITQKMSSGFALMSIVPILLALYLMVRSGSIDRDFLIGSGGIVVLLMLASAGAGFFFIKTELCRAFANLLARASRDASDELSERIRQASEDEVGRISETIDRLAGRLEERAQAAENAHGRFQSGVTRVAEAIRDTRERDQLMGLVVEGVLEALRGKTAYLVGVNEDAGDFVVTLAKGEGEEQILGKTIPLGDGVPGLTARERRPLLLQDLERSDAGGPSFASMIADSTLSAPLFQGEMLEGVLILHGRADGTKFDEQDLAVLASIVTLTAAALGQLRQRRELQESLDATLAAFATAIEERDPYARGHATRVARYCEEITKALEMDEETVRRIRRAALLHDVGKLTLPEALLRKEKRFDPEEHEQMRKHVYASEAMIRGIDELAALGPMIRHHHERCDGSGYPDGLKAEDLPLSTHVLIVANAFDTMTSDRSYRRAMSLTDALNELKEGAGERFDQRVVGALLGLDRAALKATHDSTDEGTAIRGQGTASISVLE